MVSRGRAMFYGEDLAYIHDQGFTDVARNASRTVLKVLRGQKIRNGLVVDLGCGSGVLAERLTRLGYDVLGIDVSEAMLKLARKRAPLARFERGSLFYARLPACVAVCAVGECVNYLSDGSGAHRFEEFFRRVYAALDPGGVLVFDIAEPSRSKPSLLYSAGKDWAVLVNKEEDIRRKMRVRKMTIFRKVGRLYRRSEELHRQRLYPAARMVKILEAAGFRVTPVPGYGKERFAPGHAGFIALKPK